MQEEPIVANRFQDLGRSLKPKDNIEASLTSLEQKILEYKAKKRDDADERHEKESPVSKALTLSISMFDKISKSLVESLDKYENRLNSTQREIEQIGLAIDQNLVPGEKENLKRMDNSLEEIEIVQDYSGEAIDGPRHLTGSHQKNKFTACRGESNSNSKTQPEQVPPEVEEFFKMAQSKHGINQALLELKSAVTKLLQGQKLVYIKANLVSNHHLLYEVLSLAKKSVFGLFLNPNMESSMKALLPKGVQTIHLNQLAKVGPTDILIIENGDTFEDLLPHDYRKLKTFLIQSPGPKAFIAGLTSLRAFCHFRSEMNFPFPGMNLAGLQIENLKVTTSREENKRNEIRAFLKAAGRNLQPDDKVLFLMKNEQEAFDVHKIFTQDEVLTKYVNINNFHFGPIKFPPTTNIFNLVVYYTMPRKMETLYSTITTIFNNYLYMNYNKSPTIPRIHFHVFCSEEEYLSERVKIFLRTPTRLQINRLVKHFDDLNAKFSENTNTTRTAESVGLVSMKEIEVKCDMSQAMITKLLRLFQLDQVLAVNETIPEAYKVKIPPNSPELPHPLLLILQASQKQADSYLVQLETVKELFKCSSIGEANRRLIEFKNMKLIDCELENQTLSIKFFGSISERLGDLSKSAYNKLYSEAKQEADLLKYMYLILRLGATPTQACCNPRQMNPNMQVLLKQYSLAEEHSIQELFPQNAFKEFLDPLRGSQSVIQEAIACMNHLLASNSRQGFLKKELELLRGQGQDIAREYLHHALVRALLGHPPKRQPTLKHPNPDKPLDRKQTSTNFAKVDFEYLLKYAEQALNGYLLTKSFFDEKDRD